METALKCMALATMALANLVLLLILLKLILPYFAHAPGIAKPATKSPPKPNLVGQVID